MPDHKMRSIRSVIHWEFAGIATDFLCSAHGEVRVRRMTTPVLMLLLMLAPYVVVRILSAVTHREFDLRRAAVVGLAVLFTFTGIGHFIQT